MTPYSTPFGDLGRLASAPTIHIFHPSRLEGTSFLERHPAAGRKMKLWRGLQASKGSFARSVSNVTVSRPAGPSLHGTRWSQQPPALRCDGGNPAPRTHMLLPPVSRPTVPIFGRSSTGNRCHGIRSALCGRRAAFAPRCAAVARHSLRAVRPSRGTWRAAGIAATASAYRGAAMFLGHSPQSRRCHHGHTITGFSTAAAQGSSRGRSDEVRIVTNRQTPVGTRVAVSRRVDRGPTFS
jgi:hypothetical protein